MTLERVRMGKAGKDEMKRGFILSGCHLVF